MNIEGAIYEVTKDEDQKILIAFPPVDLVPRCFFEIRVKTVGANPAQLLSAGITFASNL